MSTVRLRVESGAAMEELGRRMAGILQPGDVVILDGPLGAGKTTLARGLGDGLGVRGSVSSPTYVIARRHRPLAQGPALLHVDAYRVTADELADLELDLDAADSIAVVEWGQGKVDQWSADPLLVRIELESPDPDGPRLVAIEFDGPRWSSAGLPRLGGPS